MATYEPALDEAYGFHTLQVAGIYFAVVFEILLELMVRDLLQKLTIPQNIQEIVFRAHQGRDRLTSLFKSLTGVSLKQAMDEVKSGYYDHALQICRRRNEYLHGNDRAFDQTPIDDLQVLADHTLDVFAGVNNKYVCRQAINSPD
ncbi:MAG: hypothetical protein HWN68_13800 [Desulfobacterales bacterium]|nr:hypothetical protein [Desulfobacterales bacterium]